MKKPSPVLRTCTGSYVAVLEDYAGGIPGDDHVRGLVAPGRDAESGGGDFEFVVALPYDVVARVHQQPAHVLKEE